MILRALVVWLLLSALAVSAGVLRERLLTPRVGAQTAHVIGTAIVVAAMLVAIWLTVPWIVPELDTGRLLTLGALWTALTVAFEFGFGRFVVGHSWRKLLNDYNLLAGRIWIFVLVAVLLGPLLLGRLRADPRLAPPAGVGSEQDESIEFVKGRHGGLCVNDGQGALCRLHITVRDDGTWSAEGVQPPAPAEGAVERGAASRLAAIVEAGWDSLTARPFTGTCPMAYDGQEHYYLVRRLQIGEGAELADAEVRELRSCTHDFGYPPARRVLERLEAAWGALELPGGEAGEAGDRGPDSG